VYGQFSCVLFTVPFAEDITFDYAPSPQNPPIYSDALIHCRVSGEPEPEVSWKFRGERILPSTLPLFFVSGEGIWQYL